MADAPRPTAAEKADAAHRLADALDKVHAAMNEAWTILRERQPRGSYSSYPLFWHGDTVHRHLDKARDELWAAAKPVAQQGFDEGRTAERETARIDDGSSASNGPTSASSTTPEPSADTVAMAWRTGRSIGRTVYAVPSGAQYRDGTEIVLGMLDTPDLAAHVVKIHNQWLYGGGTDDD